MSWGSIWGVAGEGFRLSGLGASSRTLKSYSSSFKGPRRAKKELRRSGRRACASNHISPGLAEAPEVVVTCTGLPIRGPPNPPFRWPPIPQE